MDEKFQYSMERSQKKAGAAIHVSDKMDFETKANKAGHYIKVKGSVQQEDMFINISVTLMHPT